MSLAIKHGINPIIIISLAKIESGHSPTAVSTAGAIGTMQLMPETAIRELNVDPYSIADNIEGGIRYLKRLILRYGGNLTLALAAYNCGPTITDKEQRVPEYAETKTFLQKFDREYRRCMMLLSNIPATDPLHDIFWYVADPKHIFQWNGTSYIIGRSTVFI
jgi:soluble lytic murein transglycosylase-like protein